MRPRATFPLGLVTLVLALGSATSASATPLIYVEGSASALATLNPTTGAITEIGPTSVLLGGLGLEGVITAVHDGTAELDVRGKRMRASIRDLRVIGRKPSVAPTITVNVELQPHDSATSDLNVVGCTVDEALSKAERFLDESLLTDQRTVRLIHGYGTGQLKRALAGFLQQHPLVARFDSAPPDQGGGGVTVVELKD